MGFTRDGVRTYVLVLALAIVLAACSTVPFTGRSQLLLVSNAQLAAEYGDVARAVVAQAAADGTLMLERDSVQSTRTLQRVRRVATRMLAAASLRNPESQPVYVVRRPVVNAFVTPSGTIVIFSGLLEVADNEAMLAAVIGHEIGHVLAEHAAEAISQRLMVDVGIRLAVAALAAAKPKYAPTYVPIARAGLGLAAQYGVFLPFSREHESEADHIGMILMAKAGYDPTEAVHFWDKMAAQGGSRRSEFFSTHPAPDTRRDDLQRWVADVIPDFRRSHAAPNDNLQAVALVPIFPGSSQLWNELNAIMDARIQGTVTEDEANHAREELWRRVVDLSYAGLREVSPDADPEFWDQVLRLQEDRRAGRIAVWDVQAKIQQLMEEKKLVADKGRTK